MARKDIQSKEDGVTRDMTPEKSAEREYRFPDLGVSVKATSYQEALKAAKKAIKK